MQEGGWCGDEMTGSGGRGSGWDDDDVEIGMWNSNASQDTSQSMNWPPYMKKMPSKVSYSLSALSLQFSFCNAL